MKTILIKLIECEVTIRNYESFLASLKSHKAPLKIVNNYERYLSKERTKYADLLKSIQKIYPPN